MLTINNPNDISKMMEYVRTRDMINLLTYFPALSPVRNLTIIKSLEDYEQNYELVKNMFYKRCDNLIGRTQIDLTAVGGPEEHIAFIEKIKEIDKNGVLVLFDVDTPTVNRYEYDGGMSVAVDVKQGVRIESVGKGFDGGEISKGITTHERYWIPWNDLRKVSIETLHNYRDYLVDDEKYIYDYDERITRLMENGVSKEVLVQSIPKEYHEVQDFTWKMLFLDMIKKLEKMEEEFESADMKNFAVSGNIVNNVFGPWQLFDKNRFQYVKR